jgi:hypothetical protein
MGVFSTFLRSWRKSKRLQTISRELGDVSIPRTIQDLGKMGARRENAKQELFNLIEDDPLLADLMERHGGSRTKLERAYQTLCLTGGVWTRGHWVPASSLAFGGTLPFVLTCIERTTDRSEWLSISARLVDYFQKGEFKPIA